MASHSLHLLALSTAYSIEELHSVATSLTVKPLVTARIEYWIIAPSAEALRNIHWNVFLCIPNTDPLPDVIASMTEHQWSLQVHVPEQMATSFDTLNHQLKNATKEDVPLLQGTKIEISQAEDEEIEIPITPSLKTFFDTFSKNRGAVPISIFSLLAFNPGKKEQFMGYVPVFTQVLGPKHGCAAKLFGEVAEESEWEDVALVHYPSLQHFAEMVASDEYKFLDKKHKVGTTKDSGLCCLTEL